MAGKLIRVNTDLCGCKKTRKPCTRTVIDSEMKPFLVHKIAAGQGLYSWDLAQFRHPRLPNLKDLKTVDKMKWIDLRFATVASKPTLQY